VHFYSNFWRFSRSNRATVKQIRPERAARRDVAHRAALGVRAAAPPEAACPPRLRVFPRTPRAQNALEFPRATRQPAVRASRRPAVCPRFPLPCATYHDRIFVAPTSRRGGAAYLKVVHPLARAMQVSSAMAAI
jgi:hypothetical protein